MKKKNLEKLIYKSLDGILTDKEAASLEAEMRNSAEAKNLYSEILLMRKNIEALPAPDFSPLFESRVMSKLNGDKLNNSRSQNSPDMLGIIFKKFAFAAVLILLLLITYNLNSGNSYSIENLLGTFTTPLELALDPSINLIWGMI